MEKRETVIRLALEWLGTPYAHMQKVKKCGADCALFPLAVYQEAGLMPEVDIAYYPADWMLHKDEERYLNTVQQYADEVPDPEPADFVLYKFGRCFSHGAIVVAWPRIIHSIIAGRGVVLADGDTDGMLVGRERKFFRLRKLAN